MLSVYLCTCVSVYLCICVSVYLCICVSVYLCVCVSSWRLTKPSYYCCLQEPLSRRRTQQRRGVRQEITPVLNLQLEDAERRDQQRKVSFLMMSRRSSMTWYVQEVFPVFALRALLALRAYLIRSTSLILFILKTFFFRVQDFELFKFYFVYLSAIAQKLSKSGVVWIPNLVTLILFKNKLCLLYLFYVKLYFAKINF